MPAGLETLRLLRDENPYPALERSSARLANGSTENAREAGIPSYQPRVGSMFCFFFTDQRVIDYESATTSDRGRYAAYFHAMLDAGVYLAPAQFEAAFVSVAHSDDDIDQTLEAQRRALRSLT
jgi:glutamate-1-semialdehyde 2,1-aminomutase